MLPDASRHSRASAQDTLIKPPQRCIQRGLFGIDRLAEFDSLVVSNFCCPQDRIVQSRDDGTYRRAILLNCFAIPLTTDSASFVKSEHHVLCCTPGQVEHDIEIWTTRKIIYSSTQQGDLFSQSFDWSLMNANIYFEVFFGERWTPLDCGKRLNEILLVRPECGDFTHASENSVEELYALSFSIYSQLFSNWTGGSPSYVARDERGNDGQATAQEIAEKSLVAIEPEFRAAEGLGKVFSQGLRNVFQCCCFQDQTIGPGAGPDVPGQKHYRRQSGDGDRYSDQFETELRHCALSFLVCSASSFADISFVHLCPALS
jgi:hypothetical protein